MAKLAWKFLLAVVNIVLTAFLFCYVPISYLILFASIPAIVYSVYTKKFFLLCFCGLVFGVLIFVFLGGIWYQNELTEFLANLNIIVYIFVKIYPYGLSSRLLDMLSVDQIATLGLGLGAFIFLVLFIAFCGRISNLATMLNFSYFVMVFTSLYLVINVVCYFFRPLEALLFSIPLVSWFFIFLYVIVPFLAVVFTFLFIEMSILSVGERRKDRYTVEKHKAKKSRFLQKILKGLLMIIVIMFIVIVLAGFGSV